MPRAESEIAGRPLWSRVRRAIGALGILAGTAGSAGGADGVGVLAGPWSFVLPPGYVLRSDMPGAAYRKELDGPYHTAVMQIVAVDELRWSEAMAFADPAHPETEIRELLQHAVDARMRAMRHEIEDPRSGLGKAVIEPARRGLFPSHLICAANRWSAHQQTAAPHAGPDFVLRGYDVLCFDYVMDDRRAGLIALRFSERFCKALGHRPIPDLERYTGRILKSLTYLRTRRESASVALAASIDDLGAMARLALDPPMNGDLVGACPR